MPGYEDAWDTLAFNPKDFLEWWRDDASQGHSEGLS